MYLILPRGSLLRDYNFKIICHIAKDRFAQSHFGLKAIIWMSWDSITGKLSVWWRGSKMSKKRNCRNYYGLGDKPADNNCTVAFGCGVLINMPSAKSTDPLYKMYRFM
jgi:hypothetical protein